MDIDKIKNKWVIPSHSDDDLKQIAKDIFNGKIYTDRHCNSNEITQRFMVLLFMGPKKPEKPKHPNIPGTIENDRDNAIYDLIQLDKDIITYKENIKLYNIEKKVYQDEYLPSIGLIYEYMDQAGNLSFNGGPMFMSLRLLNKADTEKMFGYYEQYKELRKNVDNF